jgi:HAD superfamily phosphoserine phosphatase-like hydrolase
MAQQLKQGKPRLVVFDVEGVLVPKNRFFYEVSRTLGTTVLLKVLILGFLYEAGIFRIENVLRRVYREFGGIKTEAMQEIFGRIVATATLQALFNQLKERNCKIALISSGIPTTAVQKLAETLGANYAYGVETETADDKITGKIGGDAITKNGKTKILCNILNQTGLTIEDCIVVADDRNNRCIFMPGVLKIGVNPDFIIRVKADRVVNGRLSGIIPIIDGEKHKWSFPTVNDFVREDIHAAGIFMPVIAAIVGVPIVAALIIAIALVYTASELMRLDGHSLPVVSDITHHAASQTELFGFAAAPLYFAFGIVTTLVLFPAAASGAAIAMFCLGDSAASLFGGMISTSMPFNKGKTFEGSLAGFLFAFLGGTFFVSPLLALAGAAIAMTIEALPLPVNDNVLVPIFTGAALTLLL